MAKYLCESESVLRIRPKKIRDKVDSGGRDSHVPLVEHAPEHARTHHAVPLVEIGGRLNGRHAGEHDEEDDAQRPYVHLGRVEGLCVLYHLWRDVVLLPTHSLRRYLAGLECGRGLVHSERHSQTHAQVDDETDALRAVHEVLERHVSMRDAEAVEVRQAEQDLLEVVPRHLFLQRSVALDEVVDFSSIAEVHHRVDVVAVLATFELAHDVRVCADKLHGAEFLHWILLRLAVIGS